MNSIQDKFFLYYIYNQMFDFHIFITMRNKIFFTFTIQALFLILPFNFTMLLSSKR